MAPIPPREPKQSPKPQPMGGNMPMIFLVTMCTLCFLFILWRRASALRSVITHQLKTITHSEGAIRLSEDDGPPARAFLEDDYDDDNEGLTLEFDADAADLAGQPLELEARPSNLQDPRSLGSTSPEPRGSSQ
ncbi:hypothetical protein GGX14DRAFT_461715 [Mycena pura]|uniref:Uncharacterized protein n=1 Tax=Mycena pura TaxID=153505 RepID=A0AAD6VA38_9AGAR|nr:hypothetical protein GGX14DRAFT_461715 [Mycena pura]